MYSFKIKFDLELNFFFFPKLELIVLQGREVIYFSIPPHPPSKLDSSGF